MCDDGKYLNSILEAMTWCRKLGRRVLLVFVFVFVGMQLGRAGFFAGPLYTAMTTRLELAIVHEESIICRLQHALEKSIASILEMW